MIANRMRNRRIRLLWLAIAAILLAPISVYIYTFGVVITDNHARWGEMGSAMSGLYSPVIALLALLVVYEQLRAQNNVNRHIFDQTYIEQSRADIQYYLEQLGKALKEKDPSGTTVQSIIQKHFQPDDRLSLTSEQLKELAQVFNRQFPQPFSLWSAIYPVLAGFQAHKYHPYEHNAVLAQQKIVVVCSFETAVALDNLHYCLTEGRTKVSYAFSPLVCPAC